MCLYSFYDQKMKLDTILKHLNCIEDLTEEISYPEFVQSTLDNHI